jgi:hypothetical protein
MNQVTTHQRAILNIDARQTRQRIVRERNEHVLYDESASLILFHQFRVTISATKFVIMSEKLILLLKLHARS